MKPTTCQICGRVIMAKTGLIAHHGYQRPHQQGWQSASCLGAKFPPYEVSRDRINEVIGMMSNQLVNVQESLGKHIGSPPETLTYYPHSWPRHGGKELTYTRPHGFKPRDETPTSYQQYDYAGNHDRVWLEKLNDIAGIERFIADLKKRYANWKQPEKAR